jgi:hypothetical protein
LARAAGLWRNLNQSEGSNEMIVNSSAGKSLLTGVAALFLAFSAIGVIVINLAFPFDKPLSFILGLFLGCAASAAKIAMLERSIGKVVDMGKDAASLYAVSMYALRLALTTAVLLAAALSPFVSLWGVAAGLTSLSVSAYGHKIFRRGEQADS